MSDISLLGQDAKEEMLPGFLVVRTEVDVAPMDARVRVEGTVKELRYQENEGCFDEVSYYRSQMVHSVVNLTDFQVLRSPRFGLRQRLLNLRKAMALVYEQYLPGEESGLLAAMTLGEKRNLNVEVKNLFQDTGISHILAISGLHISMVGMMLFRRLRKKLSLFPSSCVTAGVVVLYGMLTGSSVSTNRAVGMFLIFLVATVFGLGYDLLSALSVMAMLLLWQNPYAYQQIGFVFSFGAILGVVLVAKPLQETYDRLCEFRWQTHHRMDHGKKFKKNAREIMVSQLLAGMGIQLATIPLCAWFFYGFPMYVVGVNLLVLPVLGVLITLGLLGGLLGGFLGAILGTTPLLAVLFFPCHVILYFYEALSTWSLGLPAARMICGRPAWWQILLYYGLLLGFVWGSYAYVKRHLYPLWEEVRHVKQSLANRWVRRYLVGAVAMMIPLYGGICYTPSGFEVDMLSVGQGDGIYIQSPTGEDFFIDGGSSSVKGVGEYVIEPFLKYHGVRRISYWFVSHMDEDHCNGLLELLDGDVKIAHIVLAKTVEQGEQYSLLLQRCKELEIPVLYMEEGDVIGSKKMQWECFYPPGKAVFEGANENSMCLLLTCGAFHGVFTGDLGEEQEAWLLEQSIGKRLSDLNIDLLKAGHHGSNSSSSEAWLVALHPKLTIVSAGAHNTYGHPGKEFRKRMEELGLLWHCTIWDGQIILRSQNGHMEYATPFAK